MPDLCFYAPWIMKEPIPDPFRMMLEKAGKKRISYDEADCSMRNIRKQGKVSRLHGPTLHALLTLIQIRKEKDSGAAGIQRGRDAINYFCMEYPGNQGKYVMTYNSKNGRFSGILKTEEKNEKLPGIREGKNTGEQYLALLAYVNLVPDNPLFNEEFKKNFYILEEQEKKEWGRHGSCTEGGIYLLRCHVLRSNSKSAAGNPAGKEPVPCRGTGGCASGI